MGREWPTYVMEGSSSDPSPKSKGICVSKDRVVATGLHGILSLSSWMCHSAQCGAHTGGWGAQTLFLTQIY